MKSGFGKVGLTTFVVLLEDFVTCFLVKASTMGFLGSKSLIQFDFLVEFFRFNFFSDSIIPNSDYLPQRFFTFSTFSLFSLFSLFFHFLFRCLIGGAIV